MTKKIICVLLLVCVAGSLFALDFSKAEPYSEEEFPQFTVDLRRAEIIFFGGIPLIYPVTSLIMNKVSGSTDFWKNIGITCSVTAAIALADYIIGLVQD